MTCKLLRTPLQAEEGDWDVDRAILYDTEDDDREQAIEPVISARRDLGEMEATTVGIKFRREYDSQHSWSVRLEQYVQSSDNSPSEAIGQLRDQDLYPDVTATIAQFSYSFVFQVRASRHWHWHRFGPEIGLCPTMAVTWVTPASKKHTTPQHRQMRRNTMKGAYLKQNR